MASCPGCSASLSPDARFCAACGVEVLSPDTPTRVVASRPADALSSAPSDGGRFVPGTILAGRYRVVALLGRGGMGQVYRADDLKLGQAVALKFLPDALAHDGAALARFHNEVRIARQLAHPNLCRVFDIGEVDGQHFLSMEYIDGEDLSSLIRRIGRLPAIKALEISRQLCAGLAAAHDAGVLHRDLKPANVMLDGRGRARITDFGLAGLEAEMQDATIASGTPAYMSPEQLEGKESTARSDIYALGLLLYEIFTGRRVFDAVTLPQLREQRQQSAHTNPSHWVKDLDPLVERVILRCLENDPLLRPASALQVAAALPGGDPMAAALAAGETPSPEMVAASPTQGVWTRARAAWCVAAIVAVPVLLMFTEQVNLYRMVPLERSSEVLADRARTLIASLGYSQPPRDRAYGFGLDNSYFGFEADPMPAPQRWQRLTSGQPVTYFFWYRQSPLLFQPRLSLTEAGRVMQFDPPATTEGMISVVMDPRGRLLSFDAVPPAQLASSTGSAEVDWSPLFRAAGLEPSRFTETSPQWTPAAYATHVWAWSGAFADHPDLPLRIEAASSGDRIVHFRLIAPWDVPASAVPASTDRTAVVASAMGGVLMLTVVIGAVAMVRHNLAQGRGDRRGALKLASAVLLLTFIVSMLRSDITPTVDGVKLWLAATTQGSLFIAALLWVAYIALEPQIRRQQPRLIVSWMRLLGGGFRDSLIGRDVLIGILLGLSATATLKLSGWLKFWSGHPLPPNRFLDVDTLGSLSRVLAVVPGTLVGSACAAFAVLIFLVLIRRLVRHEHLASIGLWLVSLTIVVLITARSWPVVIASGLFLALWILAISRFGLVAGIVFGTVSQLSMSFPMMPTLSVWPGGATVVALSTIGALVLYGFWATTAASPARRQEAPRDLNG